MHSFHFPSISALCRYLSFVFCFSPQHFPKRNAHTHAHTSMCFVYVYISCGSHTGMRQHSAPARICRISPGLCLILLFNCSCYFFLPAPLWIALHFAARNLMSHFLPVTAPSSACWSQFWPISDGKTFVLPNALLFVHRERWDTWRESVSPSPLRSDARCAPSAGF